MEEEPYVAAEVGPADSSAGKERAPQCNAKQSQSAQSSQVLGASAYFLSDDHQVLSGPQMGASLLPSDWELLTRSEASSSVAPVPDFIEPPSAFPDTLVWRRGSIPSHNGSLSSNSDLLASGWTTAYHHLILDEASPETLPEEVREEEGDQKATGLGSETRNPQVLPKAPQEEVSPQPSSCEGPQPSVHPSPVSEGVGSASAVGWGSSGWLSTLDGDEERSRERYGGRVWTASWWHSVAEKAGWMSLWATALAAGLVGALLLTHRWQQERRRNEKMIRIINTQQQVRWVGLMCADKWRNRSGCWAQTIGQMTVQLVRLKEALTRQRRVAVLRSSASFPAALSSIT